MKISKILFASAMMFTASAGAFAAPAADDAEMNKFIDDLMGKMTLQEKIGQLNLPVTGDIVTGAAKSSNVAERIRQGQVGGLFNLKGVEKIKDVQRIAVEESRLHIPLLFGMDVIHGYETVFPIPLGLSCTWDMEAVEKSARIAAIESSADGICWTFSPMVDICRDARWGRISEGSGEAPFLGSRIAEAMVKGYQGDLTRNDEILACVKHFALYGAPEAGRDYNTVDMSHLRMYNEYFPPYKAAIEAGAASVMASFNTVDGIPATGNRWLMTEVLRNQWKFDGFVVTDYTGIFEMIAHGMGDLQQVAAMALKAGVDMDMVSDAFVGTLEKSVKEGKVSEEEINVACRRMLEAKYRLGLFEDPYKFLDVKRPAKQIYTAENRAIAREIARESFVLLKNEGNLLPLKRKGKIALIGPLANTRANMPGTWSVAAVSSKYSTLLEGLQNAVGKKAEILYAKGSNLMYDAKMEADATMFGREMRDNRSNEEMLKEALEIAKKSDVIVAALGESSEMSGESSSRTNLEMPDAQRDLLEALLATGKPVVLVHFSGRPTVLSCESEYVPAILNVWFGGSEAADAIADVLFGDYNPGGRLPVTFYRNMSQLPDFEDYNMTGRTSRYMTQQPLFPFGYGLSYTTFEYGNLSLAKEQIKVGEPLKLTVNVTNNGQRDGEEVVQVYLKKQDDAEGPGKTLRAFKRVRIPAGKSVEVAFDLNGKELEWWDAQSNTMRVCAGRYDVMVGKSSQDRDLQRGSFVIE